jgi:hypothetical protein
VRCDRVKTASSPCAQRSSPGRGCERIRTSASWFTCRWGCSTGPRRRDGLGGERAAPKISSLGKPDSRPFTSSRDRHGRLGTHCAMVGRSDKKRSGSFSLGDGGLPFRAFLFCEACENSFFHDGEPRSLGSVNGSQIAKSRLARRAPLDGSAHKDWRPRNRPRRRLPFQVCPPWRGRPG